jgi:hypothetical protein
MQQQKQWKDQEKTLHFKRARFYPIVLSVVVGVQTVALG